jgi:hypothetical protein
MKQTPKAKKSLGTGGQLKTGAPRPTLRTLSEAELLKVRGGQSGATPPSKHAVTAIE